MTDWIHCNSCYRQPGIGKQFALTNCGHIFCQDCLRSGPDEKCKVCNEVFKSTPLNSELDRYSDFMERLGTLNFSWELKMNHEVAVYFNDPGDLLQKHLKQLTLIIQVVEFQRNHRRKLTTYNQEKLMSLLNKMTEAMAAVEKMQMVLLEMQQMQRELESIKKENIYLKQLLKSSTDRKSPNSFTRAHGDMPSKDLGTLISFIPANHTSNGRSDVLDKSSKGSAEANESFTQNLANKLSSSSSSTQKAALFSFRTPGAVSHISPGLARLSVRTPPSNGRLGEIPHYPASRNQGFYTPSMSSVRESPSPMEAKESGNDNGTMQPSSRSIPVPDRLLARFQANYPNLKP